VDIPPPEDAMPPPKPEVLQGTLDLMVLRTLEMLGPLHGFGIARRIEHLAGNGLELNHGTVYPALVRLEQQGFVSSTWGASETNRRARFYALTPAGRRQLAREAAGWARTTAMMARFLEAK
jgi:PadR family transcriptional regulator